MKGFHPRFRYKEPPPMLQMLFKGIEVAQLEKTDGGFRFRYLPAFAERRLSPLPGLGAPADTEWKTSVELPRFFKERIPDMSRPEIKELVSKLGVDQDNKLEVLGKLSRHAVTDPFELKLFRPAA